MSSIRIERLPPEQKVGGSNPLGRTKNQYLTGIWRRNSPPSYPPTSSCSVHRRYVYCGHGRQRNHGFRFRIPPWEPIRALGERSVDFDVRGLGRRPRRAPKRQRVGSRRSNAAAKGKSGSGFSIFGRPTRMAGACARKRKRRSDLPRCPNTRHSRSWQTTLANTPVG